MTVAEVLRQLETWGSAQTRKTYSRHGVTGAQFGVSYANLKALAKKIGLDLALAEALWKSGNHDARVLATMIADPKQIGDRVLAAWGRDLDNVPIADAYSALAARTPRAREKVGDWTRAKGEWLEAAGWNVIARLALKEDSLSDDVFASYLAIIERDIHSRRNRTRYAMNAALISIGLRNDELERAAIRVAEAIGRVEVDHGDTSCRTPDAIAYIRKASARRRK